MPPWTSAPSTTGGSDFFRCFCNFVQTFVKIQILNEITLLRIHVQKIHFPAPFFHAKLKRPAGKAKKPAACAYAPPPRTV
jgi:hypothetical protein